MSAKKQTIVRAFAPASVANVGCGFDVLGFAINGPGDEVEVRLTDNSGVIISKIDGDDGKLPYETEKNTAGKAVLSLLSSLDTPLRNGIDVSIHKKMPLGSGLGSSAASSVAAAVAVNRLLGEPYSREDLLPFVIDGEHAASGSPHADNVAASLLGGFILVRSNDPLDVISLPFPKDLYCTIIHPRIEIATKQTRQILRKQVPLSKAVEQWGNVGAMVAGLFKNDIDLIGRSMQDVIVEPTRSFLIPGFQKMKEAVLDHGAVGFSISGAGPSVFALSKSEEIARKVGSGAGEVLEELDLDYDVIISAINEKGAFIKDEQ